MHSPAEEVGLMGQRLATRVQSALDRVPPDGAGRADARHPRDVHRSPPLLPARRASPRPSSCSPARSRCGRTSSGTRTTSRRPSSSASSGFPTCTSRCPRCATSFASPPSRRSGCASAGRRRTARRIRCSAGSTPSSTTRRRCGRTPSSSWSRTSAASAASTSRRPPSASSPISSSPRCFEQDPGHPAPAPRRHPRAAAPGSARAPRGASAGPADRSCSSTPSSRRRAPTSPTRSRAGTRSITGIVRAPCRSERAAPAGRRGVLRRHARRRRLSRRGASSISWRTPRRAWTSGPMRTLFRQNRVVSSISAELDQKSIFELFTDPALAERLFTVEERQVMRRHVLWTRLVSRAAHHVAARRAHRPARVRARASASRSCSSPTARMAARASSSDAPQSKASGTPRWSERSPRRTRWVLQHAAPIPVKSFHVLDDADRAARRAVLRRDGVRVRPLRRGDAGARVAAAGGERRAAWRRYAR